MKKITLLMALPLLGFAQSKITNTISVTGASANILLNNNTQTATLTLKGASDRWMACQFGVFLGGMEEGSDVVYYNGTTLVDARHNGIGSAPSADSQNNWTITSNTVSAGLRTIVATRPFNSPDATDFDFDYFADDIGIAVAHSGSASYNLAYHGSNNRVVDTAVPFTNVLGVEDVTLRSASLTPNPSKGNFSVNSEVALEQVSVYTITGSFVKTVKAKDAHANQIDVEGLSAGAYLVELQGNSQKVWKKIIVE